LQHAVENEFRRHVLLVFIDAIRCHLIDGLI
jgi:hypothetical protein